MKIEIWNRQEPLKGLEKEIWFEAYPQSKNKTLVLIDDAEVMFLEDINCTNEEEVKAYIEKRKEEEKKEIQHKKDEVDKKLEKTKLDILEAVVKMQLGTSEKINAEDVPPLTDINDVGIPSNGHIDLSNIDTTNIGLIDPSLIPPPPKVD